MIVEAEKNFFYRATPWGGRTNAEHLVARCKRQSFLTSQSRFPEPGAGPAVVRALVAKVEFYRIVMDVVEFLHKRPLSVDYDASKTALPKDVINTVWLASPRLRQRRPSAISVLEYRHIRLATPRGGAIEIEE